MNPYDPQPPEVLDRDIVELSRYPPLGPIKRGSDHSSYLIEWFTSLLDGVGGRCLPYKHDMCWGATIVRVSYEDDELFARAVRAIRRLTLLRLEIERYEWETDPDTPPLQVLPVEPPDFVSDHGIRPELAPHLVKKYRSVMRVHTDANPSGRDLTMRDVVVGELLRRHHNFVLEDREALNGADPAAAWLYHEGKYRELEKHRRSSFFIYLDKESIERLARAPDDEEVAAMMRDEKAVLAWEAWVKIIDNEGHVDPDDIHIKPPPQREISPLAQRRRLFRLGQWLDFAGILADIYLDEAGCEGEAHENCPAYDVEWTFCCPCEIFEFPGKSERMEELYGPTLKPQCSCCVPVEPDAPCTYHLRYG